MVIKENEELMKTSFSFAWLFLLNISKPLTITTRSELRGSLSMMLMRTQEIDFN